MRDLEKHTGDLRTRLQFLVFSIKTSLPFDELILSVVPQDLNVKPGSVTTDLKYHHNSHLVIRKTDTEF